MGAMGERLLQRGGATPSERWGKLDLVVLVSRQKKSS